jgi:hypothetical protein
MITSQSWQIDESIRPDTNLSLSPVSRMSAASLVRLPHPDNKLRHESKTSQMIRWRKSFRQIVFVLSVANENPGMTALIEH